MIITKKTPFTKEEITQLSEEYEIYIKTVIDVKRKICSAGCTMHIDSGKLLLADGSLQEDLWGGGVNLETKDIDCNSFINMRPAQNNKSNEIQSEEIRNEYEALMKYFFQTLYDK